MVDSRNKVWVKGFLDAEVVSLLSAEFLARKVLGKHQMLKDPRQYNFYVNMDKHKAIKLSSLSSVNYFDTKY